MSFSIVEVDSGEIKVVDEDGNYAKVTTDGKLNVTMVDPQGLPIEQSAVTNETHNILHDILKQLKIQNMYFAEMNEFTIEEEGL